MNISGDSSSSPGEKECYPKKSQTDKHELPVPPDSSHISEDLTVRFVKQIEVRYCNTTGGNRTVMPNSKNDFHYFFQNGVFKATHSPAVVALLLCFLELSS